MSAIVKASREVAVPTDGAGGQSTGAGGPGLSVSEGRVSVLSLLAALVALLRSRWTLGVAAGAAALTVTPWHIGLALALAIAVIVACLVGIAREWLDERRERAQMHARRSQPARMEEPLPVEPEPVREVAVTVTVQDLPRELTAERPGEPTWAAHEAAQREEMPA